MLFLTVSGYTINTEDIRLVEWGSGSGSGGACTIYLRPATIANTGGPNQIELTAQEAKGLREHFRQLITGGQAVDLTQEGTTARPTQRARGAAAQA